MVHNPHYSRPLFWYSIIGISFITSLIWYFVEVTSPTETSQKIAVAKSHLTPIDDNFHPNAIEIIKQRKSISEFDLGQIPPYTKKQAIQNQPITGSQNYQEPLIPEVSDFDNYSVTHFEAKEIKPASNSANPAL